MTTGHTTRPDGKFLNPDDLADMEDRDIHLSDDDTQYWLAQVHPTGEAYVLEVSSVWDQQPEYSLPGGGYGREAGERIGWTITDAAGPLHRTVVEAILDDPSLGAETIAKLSDPGDAFYSAERACFRTWTWTREL